MPREGRVSYRKSIGRRVMGGIPRRVYGMRQDPLGENPQEPSLPTCCEVIPGCNLEVHVVGLIVGGLPIVDGRNSAGSVPRGAYLSTCPST